MAQFKPVDHTVKSRVPVIFEWIGDMPEYMLDPDRDRSPNSPEAKARRKKRRQKHGIPLIYEEIIVPSPERIYDEARSAAPSAETSDKPDAPTSESQSRPAAAAE